MVDITIDVLDRGSFEADLNYMVEGAVLGTDNDRNPETEFREFPVYNLVVDHPEGTILWDTGIHHEAGDGHWPQGVYNAFPAKEASDHRLDDDLKANGWEIDDIDHVIMSHLHVDHSGGLPFFAGRDTPILVHQDEIKFAYYSAVTGDGGAGYLLDDIHHDFNWQVIKSHHTEYFDGIELIHSPGHTPGVLSMLVHLDDGHSVLFTADEAYMGRNYHDEEALGAGLLWDRVAWRESLDYLKEMERRHDAELVFGHDPDQIDEIEDGWS